MGKGYISLFFDHSGYTMPQENLQEAKNKIWENYKVKYPDSLEERNDIQSFTENSILVEMQGDLQKDGSLSDPFSYWDINVGALYGVIKDNTDLLSNISEAIKFCEATQTKLSKMLDASKGLVSSNLLDTIESCKNSIEEIASRFGEVSSEKDFNRVFWGALRGAIARAQGAVHETAAAVAAKVAKDKVNKVFAETGQDIKIFIEATGGKVELDSELMQSLNDNGIEVGSTNSSKNDLTIYAKDGNGKVLWTSGISLKSTSSEMPEKVHIMSTELTTLLNRYFSSNKEEYLNLAGGLAIGDSFGNKWIARLMGRAASQGELISSSAALTESWKKMIYAAIYSQVVDMFTGFGGALNDIRYLVINSKAIPMNDLFSILENMQNPNQLTSIQGIEISGAIAAAKRDEYVNLNRQAFKIPSYDYPTTEDARIGRSTQAWNDIYNNMQSKKISISLKYKTIFGMNSR